MLYPACIETSATKAFGVVVPDLPGCFSAGDTLEEAMAMTEEAIVAWIETAIDAGQTSPSPAASKPCAKHTKSGRPGLGPW
jgi:predicted RNase H-like HicB family nuclease